MFRKNKMTCEHAKQKDMVTYLSSLGYEPAKIKGNNYWYLSPIRAEKSPSFKVNRKLNVWFDHGEGRGGNLIDFAILYHDCTVAEFLNIVGQNNDIPNWENLNFTSKSKNEPKIEIVSKKRICSASLLNYLHKRKIDIAIADNFCSEVVYRFNCSNYFAIGFKNDMGGYELRNKYFKGSCSPKAVTSIKNGADTVAVFEGFFDFLSYLCIPEALDEPKQDFLILNSLAFFESSIPLLERYKTIRLFLDNDDAGRNCVKRAIATKLPVIDESSTYRNCKDLNDFLIRKPDPEAIPERGLLKDKRKS